MKLKAFFQLIRWKNILIILLTQIIVKFVLINSYLPNTSLILYHFTLLTFSTLLIASGGNIINDIYDLKTDTINKKNKNIINQNVSKKKVLNWYYILTLLGIITGTFLAFKIEKKILSLLFISISILLFIYSKYLKQTPLIGNILISILVSLSIFIIFLFESTTINTQLFIFISCYSFFAFGINLIREIIKDIEDIDGDFSEKMKTLPILIGRKRTNKLALFLSVIFTFILFYLLLKHQESNTYFFLYGFFLLILPLLYFTTKLYTAKSKPSYKKLSSLLKIIMLLGILSIFVL